MSASPQRAFPPKPIAHVLSPEERHWVGDGFAVSTILSPHHLDAEILSPFILMDHAAPRHFAPSTRPRGVGEHPHRGFETVTFAYQGEVDHRDSQGGGGTVGAGDVQWMTAASGVVHEEMHSQRFTETGGVFEMVQLWVNLPARLKMTTPRYQALSGSTFPALDFGQGSGRLIAGSLQGRSGPAKTHSPITMFDMTLPEGSEASFELPLGHTILLFVLDGRATAQQTRQVEAGDLVVLDRTVPGAVTLKASEATRALVLSGEPLGEPVVAHGPFVMNTRAEIVQAVRDYQRGKMGTLAPTT
jgi:quercetin 2,3-dioxygenase